MHGCQGMYLYSCEVLRYGGLRQAVCMGVRACTHPCEVLRYGDLRLAICMRWVSGLPNRLSLRDACAHYIKEERALGSEQYEIPCRK